MTGIKIDELRPIVKSLNEGSITYGKAIKLINERLVFSALEDNAELTAKAKKEYTCRICKTITKDLENAKK